jgi:hypothetical protein
MMLKKLLIVPFYVFLLILGLGFVSGQDANNLPGNDLSIDWNKLDKCFPGQSQDSVTEPGGSIKIIIHDPDTVVGGERIKNFDAYDYCSSPNEITKLYCERGTEETGWMNTFTRETKACPENHICHKGTPEWGIGAFCVPQESGLTADSTDPALTSSYLLDRSGSGDPFEGAKCLENSDAEKDIYGKSKNNINKEVTEAGWVVLEQENGNTVVLYDKCREDGASVQEATCEGYKTTECPKGSSCVQVGPSAKCVGDSKRVTSNGGGGSPIPPSAVTPPGRDSPVPTPRAPTTPTDTPSAKAVRCSIDGNYVKLTFSDGSTYRDGGECLGYSSIERYRCVKGKPQKIAAECSGWCSEHDDGSAFCVGSEDNVRLIGASDQKEAPPGRAIAARVGKNFAQNFVRVLAQQGCGNVGEQVKGFVLGNFEGDKLKVVDTEFYGVMLDTIPQLRECVDVYDLDAKESGAESFYDVPVQELNQEIDTYNTAYASEPVETSMSRDLKGGATEILLRYDGGLVEGTVSGMVFFLVFVVVAFIAGFFFGKEIHFKQGKRRRK